MIRNPGIRGAIGPIPTFLVASVLTCGVIGLSVRHHLDLFGWPHALTALSVGILLCWVSLQRWRYTHPTRCAFAVGVFSALAGAGLYLLTNF